MTNNYRLILFFSLCAFVPQNSFAHSLTDKNSQDTLQVVHVYFRHGDRTPIDEYPKDPYNNVSYWPEGWGQLSKIGKQMQFNLGKYFRSQYDGFLSRSYSPSEVYVRTSYKDRTIMSALSNLAGLFPPTEEDPKSLWEPNLNWQPIPIFPLHPSVDNIIYFKQSCPRYERLLREFLEGPYMKDFDKKNADLYQYVRDNTGLNVTSYNDVADLWDTLKIQKLYNFTLPEWTDSVFPDKLYPSALLWVQKFTFTEELKKLRAGPLITEIFGTFDREIGLQEPIRVCNSSVVLPPQAKLYMYASHDDTVAAVLQAFELFEPHIPSYASSVFVELHKDENNTGSEYFVKVLYRTDLSKDYSNELKIKKCGSPCSLIRLKEILIPYLHYGNNWEQLCHI